jgi:hypothetical protein
VPFGGLQVEWNELPARGKKSGQKVELANSRQPGEEAVMVRIYGTRYASAKKCFLDFPTTILAVFLYNLYYYFYQCKIFGVEAHK